MKRIIVAVIVGGAAFAGVAAFAASLTVSSQSLGSGTSTVASCDTDGVGVTYATPAFTAGTGYTVNAVTVTGLDTTGCVGKTVYVTVAAADNTAAVVSGSVAVPAAPATSVTVNLGSPALASSVERAHVTIA